MQGYIVDQFPDEYKGFTSYKLLLILNLYNETSDYYNVNLQNDLLSISENDSINHIVIWSLSSLPPEMTRVLKKCKTDVLHISSDDISSTQVVSTFVAKSHDNLRYWLLLNRTADLLLKRLKKLFHLVLSEVAAPIYNKRYGTKAATKSFMRFEEKTIESLVQQLNSRSRTSLAIDVGCGTGRHSFLAGKFFKTVHAFDMSPNMIKEAGETLKTSKPSGKLIFSVCDFEYEKLFYESQWSGEADLIIASFGMGSFIEDTQKMLKRFYDWLRPGGFVLLSFYNADSVMLNITPNWRDTSLSAHIDKQLKTLRVTLAPNMVFHIYCKPFDNDTRSQISGLFEIDKILTYPTVMGLLPNGLLEQEEAFSLFEHVDLSLSKGDRFNNLGHYVLVVAKKPERPFTGYTNIIGILQRHQCRYEIIQHSQVYSIDDVKREIGDFPGLMLKTVIFAYKVGASRQLISVTLPSEKKVDKHKLSQILRVNPNVLKFAAEKEILSLGFPIGGIAPIGFQTESEVKKFLDQSIIDIESDWLYMGVGDNRKTLKLSKADFTKLVDSYERIIF